MDHGASKGFTGCYNNLLISFVKSMVLGKELVKPALLVVIRSFYKQIMILETG